LEESSLYLKKNLLFSLDLGVEEMLEDEDFGEQVFEGGRRFREGVVFIMAFRETKGEGVR
jgi:hypothetical protein